VKRLLEVVRAVAPSSIRMVVIVESASMSRLEWYDSDSGDRIEEARA
jgi:hypothetical protein